MAGSLTTLGLTACSGSTGPGDSSNDAATIWVLSGPLGETIRTDSVNACNEDQPDATIGLTALQNDAFKTRIRTALGGGQAPTIIWTWIGGGLSDYVKNSQVEDLTSFFAEDTELKDSLFSSSFGAATIDDKIYAVPCETVSPIIPFYNKAWSSRSAPNPPRRGPN